MIRCERPTLDEPHMLWNGRRACALQLGSSVNKVVMQELDTLRTWSGRSEPSFVSAVVSSS